MFIPWKDFWEVSEKELEKVVVALGKVTILQKTRNVQKILMFYSFTGPRLFTLLVHVFPITLILQQYNNVNLPNSRKLVVETFEKLTLKFFVFGAIVKETGYQNETVKMTANNQFLFGFGTLH